MNPYPCPFAPLVGVCMVVKCVPQIFACCQVRIQWLFMYVRCHLTSSHIFHRRFRGGRLLSINLINIIWKGNRSIEVEDDTKTMTCTLSPIPWTKTCFDPFFAQVWIFLIGTRWVLFGLCSPTILVELNMPWQNRLFFVPSINFATLNHREVFKQHQWFFLKSNSSWSTNNFMSKVKKL